MPSWQETSAAIGKAAQYLKKYQVVDATAAALLGSVPVIGPLLQELYDRNKKSGQGSGDIISLLEGLQEQDQRYFDAITKLMMRDHDEIMSGQQRLRDLVSLNFEQIQTRLDRIERKEDEIAGKEDEILAFLKSRFPYGLGPKARGLGEGIIGQVFVGANPVHVAISRSGTELYVSNLGSNTVSVVETALLEEITTIQVGQLPSSLALSPRGDKLYVGNNGKGASGVSVVDVATRQVIRTVPTVQPVRDLAVAPNGEKVYLALEYAGLAKLDTSNYRVSTVSTIMCPEGVAVAPERSRLYVSYQCTGPGGAPGHDAIGVYDMRSDSLIASIKGLANVGGAIAVSPDERQVWVNGSDACSATAYDHVGCPFVPGGVVNVIDAETSRPVKSFGIPLDQGTGFISFTPDSSTAMVGGTVAKLFDTETFRLSKIMDVPLSGSAEFARDGSHLYAPAPNQNRVVLLELS